MWGYASLASPDEPPILMVGTHTDSWYLNALFQIIIYLNDFPIKNMIMVGFCGADVINHVKIII